MPRRLAVRAARPGWIRLLQLAPPHAVRRAWEHLLLDRVEVEGGRPHAAGRVDGLAVGVETEGGGSTCACRAPQPCPHALALWAAVERLLPEQAPEAVREAPRPAFSEGDAPAPVPAFPETATDLEIPSDTLSHAQRVLVESIPGVLRRTTHAYSVPRAEAERLRGLLESAGTTLCVFARRPHARFRATLVRGANARVRLVATEMPGLRARELLDQHGFRAIRRPRSLVHEYEGPASTLHLLAERLAALQTGVVLADREPPVFEPLALPPPRTRTPFMPVVFSRRRFDWWTPRAALAPLQLAIVARHGRPADGGFRMGSDALRQAERELAAAGMHVHRVEEPDPLEAHVTPGASEGEACVRFQGRPPPAPAVEALHGQGYRLAAASPVRLETRFEGPTANLPALAVALAHHGIHLLPVGGWPPLPEVLLDEGALRADDPRVPLAREAMLLPAEEGGVRLDTRPAGAALSRGVRLALHRAGWLQPDGQVRAEADDAGRLIALLREEGVDAKWPRPASAEWRLASVRYHERSRKDGGGTILQLKGPLPLGRLGGVDPEEEARRIAAMVAQMEAALVARCPGARPLAHGALPGSWHVPGGAGAFLLDAAVRGASVTPAPGIAPLPVGRGVVLVDTACLPPRLVEYQRARPEEARGRPVVSPEIENVVRRVVPEGLEVDEDLGHYLVPSTRMSALVDALREAGAKVLQRRLAPKGKRYARWLRELPEDTTGARPKLRPPFRGRHDGPVPNLRPETRLDPHQREGLAFILHHGHCCLLADEMGLGKTLTAIAAAQFLPGRVLVVCPASARGVWRQEVLGWTHEKARVLEPGEDPKRVLDEDAGEKYVVVAYSGLARYADALRRIPFDLVILDESHYVKSRQAERTRLVEDKLRDIPRRLILSGTPVMNEPQELRTQLAFVHPEEWSDAAWFRRRFQDPWRHGTPEVKEQVLARLREYLDGVMLRREKREALPDLPGKRLHVRRLQLPPAARRAYDEQEDAFRDYVRDHEETALAGGMARTAGRIERLKQTALVGKLPLIVAEVRAMLDRGEKVVVFCHYREPIRALAQELAAYGVVTLTGSTRSQERSHVVRRFQQDKSFRVFLGQTHAAGVAVTLTAARHAVFCDLEWNPAVHRQAMDRIHRKTQTREVDVHFYLAEDTVEEDVAEVLEEKAEMMEQLLEGRKGGTFGLREKQAAQREVALRILARRRRLRAGDDA